MFSDVVVLAVVLDVIDVVVAEVVPVFLHPVFAVVDVVDVVEVGWVAVVDVFLHPVTPVVSVVAAGWVDAPNPPLGILLLRIMKGLASSSACLFNLYYYLFFLYSSIFILVINKVPSALQLIFSADVLDV